jgi:hypothetical protein
MEEVEATEEVIVLLLQMIEMDIGVEIEAAIADLILMIEMYIEEEREIELHILVIEAAETDGINLEGQDDLTSHLECRELALEIRRGRVLVEHLLPGNLFRHI